MEKGATVFVGLSGGVDSSVAALRLKNQGYRVVGVFIKVWHPDFMVCNWEAERLDAMRVAAHLEIPFLTCDAVDTYRDEVAKHFISEYQAGRTPNPDVLCNKKVKFGAFLKFAKDRGADYIATGHYVQRIESEGVATLHRGIDPNKDQSYFLWSLSQEKLDRALFPVGDCDKSQIRNEAKKARIPVAEKKDSQGVCFLGHIDIPEFLSHYITLTPGNVLDTKGVRIGTHKSALVYTLGQRHGFTLNNKNTNRELYYVVDRDIENNTITVATKPKVISQSSEVILREITLREPVHVDDTLEAQFRYRQTPLSVTINSVGVNTLTLTPKDDTERPAAGQSCVLYRGSLCIGGGIIE